MFLDLPANQQQTVKPQSCPFCHQTWIPSGVFGSVASALMVTFPWPCMYRWCRTLAAYHKMSCHGNSLSSLPELQSSTQMLPGQAPVFGTLGCQGAKYENPVVHNSWAKQLMYNDDVKYRKQSAGCIFFVHFRLQSSSPFMSHVWCDGFNGLRVFSSFWTPGRSFSQEVHVAFLGQICCTWLHVTVIFMWLSGSFDRFSQPGGSTSFCSGSLPSWMAKMLSVQVKKGQKWNKNISSKQEHTWLLVTIDQ